MYSHYLPKLKATILCVDNFHHYIVIEICYNKAIQSFRNGDTL